MGLFGKGPPVESLGALIGEADRDQRVKDTVRSASTTEQLQTVFGNEIASGRQHPERTPSFYANIKEKFLVWRKRRELEAAESAQAAEPVQSETQNILEVDEDAGQQAEEDEAIAPVERVRIITEAAKSIVEQRIDLIMKIINLTNEYNRAAIKDKVPVIAINTDLAGGASQESRAA